MSLPIPEVSPFRQDVLKGKVALITGGGSGIGYEISRQLGLHGAKVVITGRRKKVLDDSVEALAGDGITGLALQGDVRKAEDAERWVREAVERFGRLDILVNCAAGNFLVPADELSVNGFRTVMEIDTVGSFSVSRAAFPALKAAGGGVIINISATLHYGATWWQVHVGAAKAAVDSLTRSFALEWGQYNIRANGIAPGIVADTPGLSKLAGRDGSEEDKAAFTSKFIPLGHAQATWDIGITTVYLASDAARCVSGDTLVVDGAAWMWKPQLIPKEAVSKASRGVEAKSRQIVPGKSKL